MGSIMIKDTCLQQVDALLPQTLGPGSWYTAHFPTRRCTSIIGFAGHGAKTLAPTGRQAQADEAGGFLVPLLLLLVVVIGGR